MAKTSKGTLSYKTNEERSYPTRVQNMVLEHVFNEMCKGFICAFWDPDMAKVPPVSQSCVIPHIVEQKAN